MNRVTSMVDEQEVELTQRLRLGLVTQVDVDKVGVALELEAYEFAKFQEVKSLAVMEGTLSLEEGQVVYEYLGEQPSVFNKQSVAVKVVMTKLFEELLRMQIEAMR